MLLYVALSLESHTLSGHKGNTPGGTVPGQNPGGTMYTKRHLVWSGHSDSVAWDTSALRWNLTWTPKLVAGWWFGTFFMFHNIWDVILPIDELIFFRGVGIPPTRIDLRNIPLSWCPQIHPLLSTVKKIGFFPPLLSVGSQASRASFGVGWCFVLNQHNLRCHQTWQLNILHKWREGHSWENRLWMDDFLCFNIHNPLFIISELSGASKSTFDCRMVHDFYI